jgi:hypothetical protein
VVPGSGAHLGLLQSVYFTVETVATVGYGDLNFSGQSTWFVVFGIVLILLGVTLVSTAFALFTNFLVSRRIEQSLGRGKVPGMAGHVVVVGLGSVGIRVVEGLVAEGRKVVVVERDAGNRYLDRARALDVPVVIADATQRQTHASVNLGEAAAVAILTSADLTNIETGLAVRESLGERWDVVPVVLRVFDRDLARMMERNFGFRHVRSTSALAAPWFGSRRARNVLRGSAAVPGGPAHHRVGWRPPGSGHAGPVGSDPGGGAAPGLGRRRARAPATTGDEVPGRRRGLPPRSLRRDARRPAPGPAARGRLTAPGREGSGTGVPRV